MFFNESVVKRSKFPRTNGGDVHYPTNEINLAHVESLGRGKLMPFSQTGLKVWRQYCAT